MTDREDFISKVWRIAAIENPRNNDVFWNNDQVIDFEFQDLTTSLCWWADETHPKLSKYVDFWVDEYEEPIEFDFSED